MKHNDTQSGSPEIIYKDTQANIVAIAAPVEGMKAYATDTHLEGVYNGTAWKWIDASASQATVNGLTGTAVWSQPFQGASYKKFLVYLTNFTSAGTVITFATAFVKAPYVYGDAAAVAIAVTTTTTVTLTSVGAVVGFVIIEGY